MNGDSHGFTVTGYVYNNIVTTIIPIWVCLKMGIDPSVMAISRGKIMMNHGNYGYSNFTPQFVEGNIQQRSFEGIFHQQTWGEHERLLCRVMLPSWIGIMVDYHCGIAHEATHRRDDIQKLTGQKTDLTMNCDWVPTIFYRPFAMHLKNPQCFWINL